MLEATDLFLGAQLFIKHRKLWVATNRAVAYNKLFKFKFQKQPWRELK
jgi:hypothetical protein